MTVAAIASRRAAAASMSKMVVDIAAELARLKTLTLVDLRAEWRRAHRMMTPNRLSRDLLIRGIIHKLQERALGGLSKSIVRKLDRLSVAPEKSETKNLVPLISLKPGTRLVRDWHGVTHTVLIYADGVEWNGQRYRSLTVVARKITGAHWSGPRFFGLRARASGLGDEVGGANAKA